MESQRNALIVIIFSLAIPLLFWLSAAVAGLVILRHGVKDALSIVMWGSLPGIVMAVLGDITPLLTLLSTSFLAVILRTTVDLKITAICTVVLGLIFFWIFPLLMPEAIAAVQKLSEEFLAKTLEKQPELLAEFKPIVHSLMLGSLAMISALISFACLMLGRGWQASFYNPGGFSKEFHILKMPPAYSLVAVLILVISQQAPELLIGILPIISLPLLIAGVALVHGIVGIKKLGGHWLAIFYISALFFGPNLFTLLIFVALVDSFIDIRARLTPVEAPMDDEL